MMNRIIMSKVPTTPVGRVSFPDVFEPTQVNGAGDFKYRMKLVFDPTDPATAEGLEKLRAEVEAAAAKKWPSGKPKKFHDPLQDGDESGRPEYAGMVTLQLTAKDNRPPQVVDQQVRNIDPKSGNFYSGCYAKCSYNVYAWEYMNKGGVSFGLGNIQKVGDGEPFDGRTKAEDDFEPIAEDELV